MCSSRSELFQKPRAVLSTRAGSPLTSRDCVDYGVEVGGPRDEIGKALFREGPEEQAKATTTTKDSTAHTLRTKLLLFIGFIGGGRGGREG